MLIMMTERKTPSNMLLIDTSSDELELKKLELKLKIEADLKQTE